MTPAFARLRDGLAALGQEQALRRRRILDGHQGVHVRLDGCDMLSFCSNDYLGLASHPDLVAAACRAVPEQGVGAGASHLLTGHQRAHHAFEQAFANLVGLPAALLFSTGYMANLGVVTALVDRHGVVYSDRLNHASLNDAALLSRAKVVRYPHGDLDALARLMQAPVRGQRLVMVDAVFSMDGDQANLPELLALCERHDAWLLVDDAHGFGVLGPQGRGSLAHFGLSSPRLVYMATLGKAAGVAGAIVAGDTLVVDWLVQKARTAIYTTASPGFLASVLLESLRLVSGADALRDNLRQRIAQLRQGLRADGWQLMDSATAIQPVVVGSNEAVLRLSSALEAQGILVPAIRPPTVPRGTARLRITLSAAHQASDIDRLLSALRPLRME